MHLAIRLFTFSMRRRLDDDLGLPKENPQHLQQVLRIEEYPNRHFGFPMNIRSTTSHYCNKIWIILCSIHIKRACCLLLSNKNI